MSPQTKRNARRRNRRKKYAAMAVMALLLLLCAALLVGIVMLLRGGDDPNSTDTPTTPTTVGTTTTTTVTPTTTTTTKPLTFVDGHYIQEGTPPWNLVLVNQWNWLDADYYKDLVDNYIVDFSGSGSGKMDARVCEPLQQMLDAAHDDGYGSLYGGYLFRTVERSENNWKNRVQTYLNQGYSRAEAEKKAQSVKARGYTSEHNGGLAVDMIRGGDWGLSTSFENTAEFRWLQENCYKYGFILRYPKDKQEITGVIYEPWHYRYVGVEAATEIMQRGICLEEYLAEKGW